jgi:drug/metabolite transporter (DMT)-like permease
LLASLVWGLEYALAERVLHRRISPAVLVGLQMCGGSILFIIATLVRGKFSDVQTLMADRRLLGLTVMTVIAFACGNFLIASAIKTNNATAASLVEISYPLAVILFSWLLFRQVNLNIGTVLGGGFIVVGVVLMYCLG